MQKGILLAIEAFNAVILFSKLDMGGDPRGRRRADRVLGGGHAGTCKTETASGEEWCKSQTRNDETSLHHSRSFRRNETSGEKKSQKKCRYAASLSCSVTQN